MIKMKYIWIIGILSALSFVIVQKYSYSANEYRVDYIMTSYLKEEQSNIDEKHKLIVNTIKNNNLKREDYLKVDSLFTSYLNNKIDNVSLNKELNVLLPAKTIELKVQEINEENETAKSKEQVVEKAPFTEDLILLEDFKNNINSKKELINKMIVKMNKVEGRSKENYLSQEEMLMVRNMR